MSASLHLIGLVIVYMGNCELGGDCLPPAPALVRAVPVEPIDPPAPMVKVRVRVAACAEADRDLDYHICVENCSPAPAHHVILRHDLPANVKLVSASPEPNKNEPNLQWNLGTLRGGGKVEITLVLRPTTDEDLTNCTRVQFEHGQCVTTRLARTSPAPTEVVPTPPTPIKPPSKGEPPTKPEPPIKPLPPTGVPKLSLSIEGPKTQYLNQPAHYFITVKNTGNGPATNVLVTNMVPVQLTFIRASAPGKYLDNQTAWLLGTLAPGASRTVDLILQTKELGEYCNKATVIADGGLKAQTELCTSFQGLTALLLEMVDRHDPVEVDGQTSYTIVVTNQGTAPATNVRLKAILPQALSLVRAKGPADNRLGDRTGDGSQVLLFDPLPALAPKAKAEFEVFVKALRPADVRFKVELTADQLQPGGPVREEESTTIFLDAVQTGEPPLQNPAKK